MKNGVTNGTDSDHFSPDAPCTRAQIVTFLWRAAGRPGTAGKQNPFFDVPSGAWYCEAVMWAAENSITTGATSDTFDLDALCTRAQIAAFLWSFAGRPAPGESSASFADIPSDAWYKTAVRWAAGNGITTGVSADRFEPDGACSRAQAVALLHRFFEARKAL